MGCCFIVALLLISSTFGFAQIEGNTEVVPPGAENQGIAKLPEGVILLPGAIASANDSSTPLPESGSIADNAYTNQYFSLSYSFSPAWYQKYQGPPPSDSGFYVLAQLRPSAPFQQAVRGTILLAAQDSFFSLVPATNAWQLVNYAKDHLQAEYKVERAPREVTIAGHPFVRFDTFAPVPGLHRSILATELRCHVVELILTTPDDKVKDNLIHDLEKMHLPASGGAPSATDADAIPVCVKGYATKANVISRVDPVLTDRKFNPIPVRIIISKTGEVKHIHFLSAFPEQARIITDALLQWKFKPYLLDGNPVEVETGIMFGRPPMMRPQVTAKTSVTD